MSDLLQNLLTEPHAALEADADFLDPQGDAMAAFIIEDKGDIETQLSQALARLGIAVILDIIEGSCDAPDAYPVLLSPVKLVVEISENVVTNRKAGQVAGTDYLTLRQALGMVMDKLHMWQYTSNAALTLSKPAFRMIAPPRGATAAYQVYFETSETLENTRAIPDTIVVSGAPAATDTVNGEYTRSYDLAYASVAWKHQTHNDRYVYRLASTGEWYMAPPSTSPNYTHPDAGSDEPPKTGWVAGVAPESPLPTITY